MKHIVHPNTTRRPGAPMDWDEARHGPCDALPIADVVGEGGQPFMESLWRPDALELKALVDGGAVVLGIRGTSHPVVYMATAPAKAVAGADAPAGARRAVFAIDMDIDPDQIGFQLDAILDGFRVTLAELARTYIAQPGVSGIAVTRLGVAAD